MLGKYANGASYEGDVYAFASTGRHFIAGPAAGFCVNKSDPFEIASADAATCNGYNQERAPSHKIAVGAGQETVLVPELSRL